MRKPTDGQLAIGALIAFALWIFVALPLYYGPRGGDDSAAQHCSAQEEKNYGFWEKTRCDPIAYFTAWLVLFTGCLVGVSAIQGIFLYRNDKTTRIAANAAELSAKAAIGVELPIIFIEQMVLQTLPPDGLRNIQGIPPERFRPMITIRNRGRTFAELTVASINTEVYSALPITPDYKIVIPFAPGTLLVEDSRFQLPLPDTEYRVTLEAGDIAAITAQTSNLWVYGFIAYKDFMGSPHELRFCAMWEAVNPNGQPRGFVLDIRIPKGYMQKT